MAGLNAYEEQRRRQVEENKQKLAELRLHQLSAAVREAAAKPKPARKRKAPLPGHDAGEDAPLRRSGRLAGLPAENFPGGETNVRKGVTNEEISYIVTKAKEFAEKLGADHPTFVKLITSCFITKAYEHYELNLPLRFSNEYLGLGENETVVLIDEADSECEMVYMMKGPDKHFLRGDWRGFKVDYKLVPGNCLVFQLIERAKFKVYIIRPSS